MPNSNDNMGCYWIAIVTAFLAYLTHICYCLIANKAGLLLIGLIAFPIGIIHGVIIWLATLFH